MWIRFHVEPNLGSRLEYVQHLMAGQSKTIYRAGDLRGSPTKKHARCLSVWISQNKSTKEEHLLKPPLGNMPTAPVMAGNARQDKPPLQPTPIRDALESARKNMQTIREFGRLMKKMLGECPQKIYGRV